MGKCMIKIIKKFFKDFFTEPDGVTICPVRVLAILGFAWALVMNGWSVIVLKAVFDIVGFGTSYAAMIAALGLALGLKTDSERSKNNVVTV